MLLWSEQIRAARALLRWEQRDLAQASLVSLATIKRIERRPGPIHGQAATLRALQLTFEAVGIAFLNGGEPGVRIRRGIATEPGGSVEPSRTR